MHWVICLVICPVIRPVICLVILQLLRPFIHLVIPTVIRPVIWCFPIWLTSTISYPMAIFSTNEIRTFWLIPVPKKSHFIPILYQINILPTMLEGHWDIWNYPQIWYAPPFWNNLHCIKKSIDQKDWRKTGEGLTD